jgi:hypothetical protein
MRRSASRRCSTGNRSSARRWLAGCEHRAIGASYAAQGTARPSVTKGIGQHGHFVSHLESAP